MIKSKWIEPVSIYFNHIQERNSTVTILSREERKSYPGKIARHGCLIRDSRSVDVVQRGLAARTEIAAVRPDLRYVEDDVL